MPKRRYCNYDRGEAKAKLQQALNMIRAGKISKNEAAKTFKIPKGTIINKCKQLHIGKVGRPFVLTPDEEKAIVGHALKVSEWGFPFSRIDLQHLVCDLLNRKGQTVPQFTENMPTLRWVTKFIKRHGELSHRLSQNLKISKAELTPEELNRYFNSLKETLLVNEDDFIDPSRIYNYDETNLADDPGRKKFIFKRGTKYPDRVRDSTKASVSLMFCGSASGMMLPPYVVYKAEHIWSTWTTGGPPNTRYNRSKSGWFDSVIFTDWFCRLFVPNVRRRHKDGKIVVLGDNLASHFSSQVLECAQENGIVFACFPKNSTHLCQPLDVAFYAPLKRKWRNILDTWKSNQKKKSQVIQKDHFPRLLKSLCDTVCPDNYSANLISGFKKCGVMPFNPDAVISRLPQQNDPQQGSQNLVSQVVVDMLKSMRYGNQDVPKKQRKSKINVQPGQGIGLEDLQSKNDINPEAGSSSKQEKVAKNKKSQKKRKLSESSEISDENMSLHSETSEDSCFETWQANTIKKPTFNELSDEDSTDENLNLADFGEKLKEKNAPVDPEKAKVFAAGDYVVVFLNTANNKKKYYVAQITSVSQEYEVKFMRNKYSKFIWPVVEDISMVTKDSITLKLNTFHDTKRGLLFPELEHLELKIE